jgi:hypothetical protein
MEALIPITFFFCVSAVLILRPLTKKLGLLIEASTQAKLQARHNEAGEARILSALEHMTRRMELMEERLDFTERLAGPARERPRFPRRHADAQLL